MKVEKMGGRFMATARSCFENKSRFWRKERPTGLATIIAKPEKLEGSEEQGKQVLPGKLESRE
jgi:hypothetical protein